VSLYMFGPWLQVLVWDECLTGPVGLIAEYSVLKEHEVTKMFPLKANGALPPINADNVVFIVRPVVDICDAVAANIKAEEKRGGGSGTKKDYHCLFVPKKSLLCEKRLKGESHFFQCTVFRYFMLSPFLQCHSFVDRVLDPDPHLNFGRRDSDPGGQK
jgi:hypothetical protein